MASLYRKHRPRTFADVVGQEHVVRTLQAAVEQDRVAHAYLFAGPRGTGKTSLAKILAKALNCEHGPTPTPDGTCERCMAIHEARSLDVIELDAASNRGIDTIRESVIERASLAPIEGGRKIYILDEAHSLTADASNALLKTLEEPPDKVVFILCTTDAGKLLPTVRSRCQRFAFRRPGPGELATVLRRIADAEQIEATDAALHLIARAAGGSFRDAVGTLDQLATVTHGQISADEAARVLGLVPEQALSDIVDLIADGDAGGVLRRIDELASGRAGSVGPRARAARAVAAAVPDPARRRASGVRGAPARPPRGPAPAGTRAPAGRDRPHDRPPRGRPERAARGLRSPPVARACPAQGGASRERRARPAARPHRAARAGAVGRRSSAAAARAATPVPAARGSRARAACRAGGQRSCPGPGARSTAHARGAATRRRSSELADIEALRDAWPAVLDRLDPATRAALDPSYPAVLNDGSLIVHVRGPMLAMASQRGEVVARAVAEECGVRVVMSFAAAAQRPRETGSS